MYAAGERIDQGFRASDDYSVQHCLRSRARYDDG